MIYRLLKNYDDEDIQDILAVYMQPSVSRFIAIDKENYWRYITTTDNVCFYKIYSENILVATMHLESVDNILYVSVVVFPEYQKQGIATTVLKDIQAGKFGLDFNEIHVYIDEKNIASLKLFEKVGFVCIDKNEELLEYEYKII